MKVAMSELDAKGTLALTAKVSKALDDVNLASGRSRFLTAWNDLEDSVHLRTSFFNVNGKNVSDSHGCSMAQRLTQCLLSGCRPRPCPPRCGA